MDRTGKLGALLRSAHLNATVAWALLFGVGLVAGVNAFEGNLLWAGFATVVAIVGLVPPLTFRRRTVMLPWEVLLLVVLPLVGRTLVAGAMAELFTSHISIAALALLLAVELHVFTVIRMTDWFATSFVVITTVATAGLWAVILWISDNFLRTLFIPGLRTLMLHFTAATVAGVGSGAVFTLYFRRITGLYHRCCPGFHPNYSMTESTRTPVRLRDRIGLSEQHERQLVRVLQLVLGGFFVVGLAQGNLSVSINSVLALLVTQLPAVLERNYQLSMDSGLVLWITTAVFVHAVGALGPYQTIPWWDTVAHMLSSSVVAAIGYTTVRAISEHTSGVWIPPRLLLVFVMLFVIAAGVLWEVIEFVTGEVATVFGITDVLIQYGLRDTMLDLIFDIVGGLIVAIWGTIYLESAVEEVGVLLDK